MTISEPVEFVVRDLHYAAYLVVSSIPLVRTNRHGQESQFVFSASPARRAELELAWINATAVVPARPFVDALRHLRSIIRGHEVPAWSTEVTTRRGSR